MEPTPEQLARFRARVARDLAYYQGCRERVEDHTPLHVAIGSVVERLVQLDEYLGTPQAPFTQAELAAMGTAATEWHVPRDRGGRRLRGVNDPANDRKP